MNTLKLVQLELPLIGGNKGGRANIDREKGVDCTQHMDVLAHILLWSEGEEINTVKKCCRSVQYATKSGKVLG